MTATLPSENPTKSFWHSEPPEFLLGHRTTAELPSTADVVIIGSGITGTSAANFLAANGASGRTLRSIVMLEAREACWGATGRNGGHCQPLFLGRDADVGHFELRNYEYIKSIIEEHCISCEWRSSTSFASFWTDKLAEMARVAVEELHKKAPELEEKVQFTNSKSDRDRCCVPDAPGATLTEGAASLWPYKLVTWILEKLVKDGQINLQCNTPVTELSPIPSSADGSKSARHSVRTPRGSIHARHVVLATNGYTSRLLPSFADLIVPVRATMSALRPPPNASLLSNTYDFQGARGGTVNHYDYLNQRPLAAGGHYMFGGGMQAGVLPMVGVSDDSVLDESSARYLKESLLILMKLPADTKGLQMLEASHAWSGIMGYSRDENPWVGAVPDSAGLWMAAGYSGHGMPNGPLCGKAVADMVVADEKGESQDAVCDWLVKEEGLPRRYLVSRVRMEQAKSFATVAEVMA